MSRLAKLKAELKQCQGRFPYREAESLMKLLGYNLKKTSSGSKTGGSRRRFVHPTTKDMIHLHEPHPEKEMKEYAVRELRDHLRARGLL